MATTAIGVGAARELDELYRTHAAAVFRYAYAVLGNRADAEDVTQTTFVNALGALERGEQPRKPANWLITIAHNLIRQRFRQQQSRPREVELGHDLPAAEAADDATSVDDLVRALQRIPPTQRQALVLRELEGRSYNEIAVMLDISVSALEALIFRARRSLAEELENLVTCDSAELALSRRTDGRLGRKERRRLLAHVSECASCARVAARSMKHRRAFKALAVLPLPFSLTLFKGTPTAAAAAALPTIGGGATVGTAAAVGATGVTAKIAVGLAAVAVAGGAGYEGVQAVREPAAPARAASIQAAAKPVQAPVAVPAARPVAAKTSVEGGGERKPSVAKRDRAAAAEAKSRPDKTSRAKPARTKAVPKATRGRPAKAATPARGRSAAAPGRAKAPAAERVAAPKREKAKQPARAKPAEPIRPAKVVEVTDPITPVKAAKARGASPIAPAKPPKPR